MSTTTGRAPSSWALARSRRARRHLSVNLVLGVLLVAAAGATLSIGTTVQSPAEVLGALLGLDGAGPNYSILRIRLPRAVLGVAVGACFGLGGAAFQTMLRNPLASPDIIGISAGASTAGAFAIVVLGWGPVATSAFAIVTALVVAVAIYLLSRSGGAPGTRLILIGIGIAAMLNSLTSYVLSQANHWDLQTVMRWLSGSLNGADWTRAAPVLAGLAVGAPLLLSQSRGLGALRLGDELATGLGVETERVRLLAVIGAVGLIAFATAAVGPVAFASFLAGPIAARLIPPGRSVLVTAGLTGALLVLVADLLGQHLLGTRYPVGVITGVLGAPYLIFLLIRSNKTGGSL